jgi:hypothetical protein
MARTKWPSRAQRAPTPATRARKAAHDSAVHAQKVAQSGKKPTRAQAFCRNALATTGYYYYHVHPIPTDCLYANKPSYLLFFTTVWSLVTPARVGAAAGGACHGSI